MESYSRAYPLLTRLHILQEIESGNRLVNQLDNKGTAMKSNSLDISRKNSENKILKSIKDKEKLKELHWEERLQLMTPSFRERSTTLAVRRCILGKMHGIESDLSIQCVLILFCVVSR